MNRGSFGEVRNLATRPDVTGYGIETETFAMAVGNTQAQIDAVALEITQIESKIQVQRQNINNMWSQWKKCDDTDCKPWHGKNRCGTCRDNAVGKNNSKVNDAKIQISTLESSLNQKKATLQGLRDTLASDQQAIETLAQQGQTPDSVVATAMGNAQAKVESDKQKAKTRKIVIVSIAVAVVLLGAFYAYRVIKAKKLENKAK